MDDVDSGSSWWQDLIDTAPLFVKGMWMTVQLAVASIIIACVFGAVLTMMRTSGFAAVRLIAAAYIHVIRGTPLVTQLFVIYFGLAGIATLSAFWAGVIGLAAHNSAYVSEIFRSGLQSVPVGQVEAGRSLGMSKTVTLRRVIAPQALRNILPALANQFIIAIKDTSIVSFITVTELFQVAQISAAETFKPLEFYLIVSLYYLVLVSALTYLAHLMERRVRRYTV